MRPFFCLLVAFSTSVAYAQHDASHAHTDTTAGVPSGLTSAEADGLLAGAGMGMAKPAEMHGYPGPLHVLELAGELNLTDAQRVRAEALRAHMLGETRALGAQLVDVEAHLDVAFARGDMTAEAVDKMTTHAALLRGRIRGSHLKAHVALRASLTDEQVARYNALRGHVDARDR